MIVTEEEAKTKRCHEVGIAMQTETLRAGINPVFCIGSACMAWRFHGYRVKNAKGVGSINPGHPGNLIEGCTAEYVGFCGKAGKP